MGVKIVLPAETFDEVKAWKKRVLYFYRKYGYLYGELTAWKWDTYQDMIKALSFMKHELKQDEFTSKDYEALIDGTTQ